MMRAYQSIALVALLGSYSLHAQAGEFAFGSGTLNIQGGLLGLETEINAPVTTYTVKEHHADIFSSNWFYNYQIAYYSAPNLSSAGGTTVTSFGTDSLLSSIDYEFAGFDGQVTLGYDVYKRGPFDYVGFGVSLGIATPYLKNSEEAADDDGEDSGDSDGSTGGDTGSVTDVIASTTELFGYKVGPKIMVSKSFGEYASLFAEASYAWQTMNVSNSAIDLDTTVNGTYFSYGIGMRYQPISTKTKIGFITLEPALYMTFGVNYARLLLDDLQVDLSGNNFALEDSKLDMSSTTLYLGLGYAF
ncbi:MAG: hypothetical protein JXK16_07995 [Thiotrichales bacterium]|nr:hypothetical protein [Thiotrichales bacterium]